jgi:hypothetical protein
MVSHAICDGFTELSKYAEEARVKAQRARARGIGILIDYYNVANVDVLKELATIANFESLATKREFVSNALNLIKALDDLCMTVFINDTGEIFYREENTPDEDAYNAALTAFNVSIYPAHADVFHAFDAADIAFSGIYMNNPSINYEDYNARIFLIACENFNKACAALKNLHKQAEYDITIAIRISRILRYDIYARADAASKASLMCERVSTHFKNAYAASNAYYTASDAHHAANQAALLATSAAAKLASQTFKKTAEELPTDFAAIWEMLATIEQ